MARLSWYAGMARGHCSWMSLYHAGHSHARPTRAAEQDAVFVHSSVALALGERLGVRFPQDEFACYRQSALWMQMPAARVREWFFAGHPLDSLGNIWSNLTRMSEAAGRADAPFSL